MDKLLSRIWDSVVTGANVMHIADNTLKVEDKRKAKKSFEDEFLRLYKKICSEYMLEDTEALDRHKVAAISMISIIKCNMLKGENADSHNKKFMGNYILATDCGFAYMLKELNKKLQDLGQKKIEKIFFPEAMACETNYYRIFYRNLYFANNEEAWGLNPLDIAERLFLLEYMTLEKNGIDPSILKEY